MLISALMQEKQWTTQTLSASNYQIPIMIKWFDTLFTSPQNGLQWLKLLFPSSRF